MTTTTNQNNQLSNNTALTFKSELTEDKELRVFGTSDKPLFIAKDIAKFLGYKDTRKATKQHIDNEDKLTCKQYLENRGGDSPPLKIQDQTILINESGLYSLILRSKLDKAKKFKRWVTSEVLPSIRKTGQYKINTVAQKQIQFLQRTIETTTSKNLVLQKSLNHINRLHENLRRTRSYHKFKKGACCYIVSDPWRKDAYYKVGETSNIDGRLQQYRTSMPMCRVEFLVYLDEQKTLEKCMKLKFAKHLDSNNHEYVSNIKLDVLIKSYKAIVKYLNLPVTYDNTLDKYNNIISSPSPQLIFIEEPVQEPEVIEEEEEREDEVVVPPIVPPIVTVEHVCKLCDKKYKYAGTLKNHMAKKHNKTTPLTLTLVCTYNGCTRGGKPFGDKGELTRHVKTVHKKENRIKCSKCTKVFSSRDTLSSHIKNVHLKQTAKMCVYCGISCTTSGNLSKHIQQCHTDNCKVKCDICDKVYTNKFILRDHIKIYHERSQKCKVCGNILVSKAGLRYHMFNSHQTVLEK